MIFLRTAVPTLSRFSFSLALALWLGGLITIGALVAPTAFHVVRSSHVLAGQIAAQTAIAGGVVGDSLRTFNAVCALCGVVLLVSQSLLWRFASARLARPILLLTLLLLGTTLYLGQTLFPLLDAAQAAGQMARFDLLHKRYEALSVQFQFPLLLLLALLAASRDSASTSATK